MIGYKWRNKAALLRHRRAPALLNAGSASSHPAPDSKETRRAVGEIRSKVIGGLQMNDMVASFIRVKRIDSFQKLRFLLFLRQRPELTGTSRVFAELLYLGDVRLLEEIITDLQMAGLVDCVGENRYKLCDEPDVRSGLQYLARAFEDPLARQEILAQVRYSAPLGRY